MSACVFQLKEFAGSSRGLLARLILPNNEVGYLEDVTAISYSVYNVTDALAPVEGTLVVADVMYANEQAWDTDDDGYTFKWEAPGELWPLADKIYRVVVTFQIDAVVPYNVIEVWEVESTSPSGL